MKIFATYLTLHLTRKPEWLDDFLSAYHEPVELHITLTQARYIEEGQIDVLYAAVGRVLNEHLQLPRESRVLFDKLIVDQEPDGTYTYMLTTTRNTFISNLQHDMRAAIAQHVHYVDVATKEYEEHFMPHITIATNIDEAAKPEVEKYVGNGFECEGVIDALVLPVVDNTSVEERTDRTKQRVYKL